MKGLEKEKSPQRGRQKNTEYAFTIIGMHIYALYISQESENEGEIHVSK